MIAAALCCTWCLLARFMRTLAMAPPCGPVDCADLNRCWGLHTPSPLNLRCDLKSDGGGWTILQQRRCSYLAFYRKWAVYKRGFSYRDTFWLGLDNLYRLTRNHESTLRVELTFGRDRTTFWAEYDGVTFGNEAAFYALNYSVYNKRSQLEDGLLHHTGPFCCWDSPAGDIWRMRAMYRRTAWWFTKSKKYRSDPKSLLNGRVKGQSVYWIGIRDISFTLIKFRPSKFADCDKSCPNGGTCVLASGTFHCRCALGYKGRRCEMSDSSYVPAVPCYCFKGGTCLVDGSCLCPLGYTGSKCHEQITSDVATSPGSGVVATSPRSGVVATSPGSGVVATSPGSVVVATSPGSVVVATSPGSGVVATSPGSAVVATSPGSGYLPYGCSVTLLQSTDQYE